jgi:hypothetical protein
MASHLLGVLQPAVVFQVNGGAGCSPGVTSDGGEKARRFDRRYRSRRADTIARPHRAARRFLATGAPGPHNGRQRQSRCAAAPIRQTGSVRRKGKKRAAWELFALLNPINHGSTAAQISTYKIDREANPEIEHHGSRGVNAKTASARR